MTAVAAATGRRVETASTLPTLAALQRTSNYALFAVESALMNAADARLTTFAQPQYAPPLPPPGVATRVTHGSGGPFWHGAVMPQHVRRGDAMGRLCQHRFPSVLAAGAVAEDGSALRPPGGVADTGSTDGALRLWGVLRLSAAALRRGVPLASADE